MSTTDPKKIAFRGTTNTDLQKHINNYFTTLGGINPKKLNYTSFNYYYFIVDSGEIIRASILPAGYIKREPRDYFKDSLGGIKEERKFAFLGSKHPEIQKAILDFFIKLGASNKLQVEGKNVNLYYFIDATNKINNSRDLPEGYIHQLQTYLNVMKNKEEKIPEYVECTLQQIGSDYKLGEIYKVSPSSQNANKIESHNNQGMAFYQMNKHRFKPSTKEAYDAQNTYLKAAEYTPQVGDYVVMEKAGGWGYSPDNNGCVALVNRIGKTIAYGIEVFSIGGEVINPNKGHAVKFSGIPQFADKEVVFRKALPHEIPSSNVKVEPQQQVVEWSEGTYAVAIKGNFGVFFSANKLPIGKIFTIIHNNNDSRDSIAARESQYWIYKANLKWFATYDEAVQFSNRLPQFEASPTAAVSESPLEICRKMYKKGMLVRSAKEYGEHSGEFIIDVDPSKFTNTGGGVDYFQSKGWLYLDGKFANILEKPKESLTKGGIENISSEYPVLAYPVLPDSAFPVKALKKQLKIVNFQSVHEIKTVEEKLLKKTKSKLFNI